MNHLIGANGFIGTQLCSFLDAHGEDYIGYSNIKDDNCVFFDLASFEEKDLVFNKNDTVVMLAAISSPDICQNQYEKAYEINVIGTSKLITYALKCGARVIFFSSDTVNGPTGDRVFDEHSAPRPVGNYAKMKFIIEEKFRDASGFKAIRLSYVLSDFDKFSKYLNNCARTGEEAEVFDGLFRNVIRLETVLEAVLCLIRDFDFNDYYLINLSGTQCLSRADLAKAYQKFVDPSLKYHLVPTPDEIVCSRPNIINTKSLYLEKLLHHPLENIYK